MGRTALRKRGGDMNKLTDKERSFVCEYLLNRNGIESVIAAGYKGNRATARNMACKLLKRPRIAAILGKVFHNQQERYKADSDEILEQVSWAATMDIGEFFDKEGILVMNHRVVNGKVVGSTIHDLPKRVRSVINSVKQKVKRTIINDKTIIEEVETELKMVSKEKAWELGMRYHGMFEKDTSQKGVNVLSINFGDLPPLDNRTVEDDLEEETQKITLDVKSRKT